MSNFLFILIISILTTICVGQKAPDTLQVLARQVEVGEGSKIYIAKYKVLKVIEGVLKAPTISVGYANYLGISHATETVLLTLVKYDGETSIQNYYHFPNYNALKGAEIVNLFFINRDDWKDCEKGEETCLPLDFYRDQKFKKSFLLLPCGGTSTAVTLSDSKRELWKNNYTVEDCPPIIDVTKLVNGKYNVHMLACGLGGLVQFNLKTK